MASSIQFLGAAGTVTGSRHLVEHNGVRVLMDCGLFQGRKEIRQRNWEAFPVPPSSLHAVVLSHAHIDHSGWLPRLIKEGFRGRVWCTHATHDLCAIMLPDSGHLHEEEAEFNNRRKTSRHAPALPLYTEEDAVKTLPYLKPVSYLTAKEVAPGITLTFHRAGHILGSAYVQLDLSSPDGSVHTVVFSGDLGRYGMPVIPDPEPLKRTSSLLVECTYADRSHGAGSPRGGLGDEVNLAVKRGGALIIPSFAIGRAQDVLYHLRRLQVEKQIPDNIPIYVDSPMACDATPLYLTHREEHDDEMIRLLKEGGRPLNPNGLQFVQGREQSKAINGVKGPVIIISASGMATGGRVLHHLAHRLPDEKTTVLFVGYQAEGTRGRRLLDGEEKVRMFGMDVPVRARVCKLDGFSAHADKDEVDRWLSTLERPPVRTFCIHGEPSSLAAAHARFQARGLNPYVPAHLETVSLV